ncbi:MAG: DUF2956 family protein [Gammaproteobacteria bacterium]|nr:DUF2956 family protein [Gammaproteobacteria bacterium]
MAKYKRRKAQISDETRAEALSIANGIKREGQTKEHTKLIAQGIEKGIQQHKRQQKTKARQGQEQRRQREYKQPPAAAMETPPPSPPASAKLPWTLLILTWLGITGYALYASGFIPGT